MAEGKDETAAAAARVLDVSRLLSRLHRRAPTGIDRVELAYARHYVGRAAEGDVRFLLTTPLNTALLSRPVARRLVHTAIERWSHTAPDAAADPAFVALREILQSPIVPRREHVKINVALPPDDIGDARAAALKASAYVHGTLRGAVGARPGQLRCGPGWYLHVSHINVHDPPRLAWVRRSSLRRLFMVHDLIPISHPEYCRPGEDARHRRRVETIARLANMVIFNSAFTRAAWDDYIGAHGLPAPPGAVVPLGVEDVFIDADPGPRLQTDVPYFVVVGTIEARKNIAFLLEVWKQWTQSHHAPRARLVIVGRRGWESENVFDLLDRSPALASSVVEVAELGDAALVALLRGARAALQPSLVEGFGLPLAEALALGVPVIASDIDAFREVSGACADHINPIDGPGWVTAFEHYTYPDAPRREAMRLKATRYQPNRWDTHMAAVEAILSCTTQAP